MPHFGFGCKFCHRLSIRVQGYMHLESNYTHDFTLPQEVDMPRRRIRSPTLVFLASLVVNYLRRQWNMEHLSGALLSGLSAPVVPDSG